jgi:aryl-alcohol dehydrogenase-like predicted oxidoreductase
MAEDVARKMVDRALEAGINFFDTADMYSAGQSEEILGKALGARRQDVVLATKCFFRTAPAIVHGGLSRRHVIDACEASLRRLGTDFIDIYILHNVDFLTPLEETARALEDLERAGKIRYSGISNYSAWQAEKLLNIQAGLGYSPSVATQIYYSLLGRDIEWEIVPQSESAGLGTMIWSPLAGGFLSGKYTRKTPDGGGGRRKSFDFPPIDVELGFDVIDALIEIAAAHDATPAQVALAWVLARPWVHTVIIGANTLAQLDDNLGAVGIELTDEEVERLDELTAPPPPYPKWIHWGEEGAMKAIAEGWKPDA